MRIARQVILNKKATPSLAQDVSGHSDGTYTGAAYAGHQNNCGRSPDIGAGADWDAKTVTLTFAPNSLAFAAAFCHGGEDHYPPEHLKMRLYMDGVLMGESSYLPWGYDASVSYDRTVTGFKAMSGTKTVKNSIHNYYTSVCHFQSAMGANSTYSGVSIAVGSVKVS